MAAGAMSAAGGWATTCTSSAGNYCGGNECAATPGRWRPESRQRQSQPPSPTGAGSLSPEMFEVLLVTAGNFRRSTVCRDYPRPALYYFAFNLTLTIQSKPVRDWICAG